MAIKSKTPPPKKKKSKLGAPPEEDSAKRFNNLDKPADNKLVSLNFYVPKEFKTAIKTFAFMNDTAMVQIMMEAVNKHIEENS